jgi:predicted protein tyrosine phosphatase
MTSIDCSWPQIVSSWLQKDSFIAIHCIAGFERSPALLIVTTA